MERNNCCDADERALSERVTAFKVEMEGVMGYCKTQTKNWRPSILPIRPDYIFAPIESQMSLFVNKTICEWELNQWID
jgi:hypothetical protein